MACYGFCPWGRHLSFFFSGLGVLFVTFHTALPKCTLIMLTCQRSTLDYQHGWLLSNKMGSPQNNTNFHTNASDADFEKSLMFFWFLLTKLLFYLLKSLCNLSLVHFASALMGNHGKIEGNTLSPCWQARQKYTSVPAFHTLSTFVWSSSEERLSKLLKFKIRSSTELAWLRYFTTVSLSLSNCSHLFIVT